MSPLSPVEMADRGDMSKLTPFQSKQCWMLTWPALDHKFKPGTNDIGFRQWWDKGITAICSLHSHREGTSKVLNNYKRNLT